MPNEQSDPIAARDEQLRKPPREKQLPDISVIAPMPPVKPPRQQFIPRGSTYRRHAVALAQQVQLIAAGDVDAEVLGKVILMAGRALKASEPWRGYVSTLLDKMSVDGNSPACRQVAEDVLRAADVGAPTSGEGG